MSKNKSESKGTVRLKTVTGESIILPEKGESKNKLSLIDFSATSVNMARIVDKLEHEIAWRRCDVVLKDYSTGKVIFERNNIEVPAHWDENAVRITADKYLFGSDKNAPEYEDSFRDIFNRIANTYTVWGWMDGYFNDETELFFFNAYIKYLLINQYWAPNSPVWFNIGHWEQWRWGRPDLRELYTNTGNATYKAKVDADGNVTSELTNSMYEYPQCSACFLTEIGDSMEDILKHTMTEGRIFSAGSGIGVNLSTIRSSKEKIKGKGRSSGPIGFDRGYDKMAGAIKSGGKTRRAARMVLMDHDHPDVFQFLNVKKAQEDIAKVMLREHNTLAKLKKAVEHLGGKDEYSRITAEVVKSIPLANTTVFSPQMDALLYGETLSNQNANHSISLKEDFWQAYKNGTETSTRLVTDPDTVSENYEPQKLLEAMADAIWENGEPGIHNNDIINEWNPVASDGRINTSNPCVVGSTLVTTDKGLFPIKALVGKTNIKVLTKDGTFCKASKIWKTGTKDTYKLTTRDGYSLVGTADHKILTNDGWVELAKLQKDAKVILGLNLNEKPNNCFDKLSWLLGYILGNGCVSSDIIAINIGHNTALADKVKDILNELKLELGSTKQSKAATNVRSTPTGLVVSTCTKEIVNLVTNILNVDNKAPNKAIKDFSKIKCIKSLIAGYFDADGTVADYSDKSQYVAIDSASKTLLDQIQILLTSYGIKSKLYTNRRNGKNTAQLPDGKGGSKVYNVHETHSLRVSRDSKNKFLSIIPIQHEEKKRKFESMCISKKSYADKNFSYVESVEEEGHEDVFDLTEPTTSSFVANGIVVHNCSEYIHLNNTSCNLSSVNLYRFLSGNIFDYSTFTTAIQVAMVCADLNITHGGFPIQEIAEGTAKYRTTGIGFANLGGMLMSLGIPYDSAEGRWIAAGLTSLLTSTCWMTSKNLGAKLGAYPRFEQTKHDLFKVLGKHSRYAYDLVHSNITNVRLAYSDCLTPYSSIPGNLGRLADMSKTLWQNIETLTFTKDVTFRNSFVTVMAPTGTISAPLGCYDEGTTSIEPDYTLVKTKQLSGGGMLKLFNSLAIKGLQALNYRDEDILRIAFHVAGYAGYKTTKAILKVDYDVDLGDISWNGKTFNLTNMDKTAANELLDELSKMSGYEPDCPNPELFKGKGHVEGTLVKPEHLAVFDCATVATDGTRYISPDGHLKMLGAIQPFISGASSKTVNLPTTVTREEIVDLIVRSHDLGIKCIALYRADSKANAVYLDESGSSMFNETTILNNIKTIVKKELDKKEKAVSQQRKISGRRASQTIKFNIGGTLSGYITVGTFADNTCGEVFGRLGQVGSFASCMFEAFCKLLSKSLQFNVPIEEVISSFKNYAFEPSGFCKVGDDNPTDTCAEIRSCASVVDLTVKILAWLFPASNGYKLIGLSSDEINLGTISTSDNNLGTIVTDTAMSDTTPKITTQVGSNKPNGLNGAAICPQCHSLAYVQDGKCKSCRSCGFKDGGCGE